MGLGKLTAASQGSASAFWFFDAGAAAWVQALSLLIASGTASRAVDSKTWMPVLQAWRSGGAAAWAALHEVQAEHGPSDPSTALLEVPLALFHARDPKRALRAVDRAWDMLTMDNLRILGTTWPLTVGLCHALDGDLKGARTYLDPAGISAKRDSLGLWQTTELRYHFARYAWADGERERALDVIDSVVNEDADYAGRLLTDRTWRESVPPLYVTDITNRMGERVQAIRDELVRWRQSKVNSPPGVIPLVDRIEDLLSYAPNDGLILMAIGTALSSATTEMVRQEREGAGLAQQVRRLQQFAKALPVDLPLSLGPGFAPRFSGVGSDLTVLQTLIDANEVSIAADFADLLLDHAPRVAHVAVKAALFRFANALVMLGEHLLERQRPSDQARYEQAIETLGVCRPMMDALAQMSPSSSEGFALELGDVWNALQGEIKLWTSSEEAATGVPVISAGAEEVSVPRGHFRAVQIDLRDATHQSLPGAIVRWRVSEGPARAKDGLMGLGDQWALTMSSGRTFLTLMVDSAVESGTVGAVELEALFDLAYHLKHADTIFKRVFASS
jgi:hypothetical protein